MENICVLFLTLSLITPEILLLLILLWFLEFSVCCFIWELKMGVFYIRQGSPNRTNRSYVCVCVRLRSWLTRLWWLASLKFVGEAHRLGILPGVILVLESEGRMPSSSGDFSFFLLITSTGWGLHTIWREIYFIQSLLI